MKKVSDQAGFRSSLEYLGVFSGFDNYIFNNKDTYYQLKYSDNIWSLLCKNGYLIITNVTIIILLNTHLNNIEK